MPRRLVPCPTPSRSHIMMAARASGFCPLAPAARKAGQGGWAGGARLWSRAVHCPPPPAPTPAPLPCPQHSQGRPGPLLLSAVLERQREGHRGGGRSTWNMQTPDVVRHAGLPKAMVWVFSGQPAQHPPRPQGRLPACTQNALLCRNAAPPVCYHFAGRRASAALLRGLAGLGAFAVCIRFGFCWGGSRSVSAGPLPRGRETQSGRRSQGTEWGGRWGLGHTINTTILDTKHRFV